MKKLEVTDVKKMTEEEKSKVKKKVEKMSEESKKAVIEVKKSMAEERLDNAKAYDEQLQKEMLNVTQSFFNIGMILSKIQNNGYYRTLGYATIEEYAEERYNIKRRNCYNLIAVYELTKDFGASIIREDYAKFEFSKLVRLSRSKWANGDLIKVVRPDNTVMQIEKFVRYWNNYTEKHSVTPDYKSIEDWEKDNPELVHTCAQNLDKKDNQEKVHTCGQNESKEIKTDIEVVEVKEEPVTVTEEVVTVSEYDRYNFIDITQSPAMIKSTITLKLHKFMIEYNYDVKLYGRDSRYNLALNIAKIITDMLIQK